MLWPALLYAVHSVGAELGLRPRRGDGCPASRGALVAPLGPR